MSELPMLTPADTPIFDEFVIADFEKHWDEELCCAMCEVPPVVDVCMTCCPFHAALCATHLQTTRAATHIQAVATNGVRCKTCYHDFPGVRTLDEVAKVVPL